MCSISNNYAVYGLEVAIKTKQHAIPAMQRVRSLVPSYHSMTTVVESSFECLCPAVCRYGGNCGQIPRSGCAHPAWNDVGGVMLVLIAQYPFISQHSLFLSTV